MCFSILLFSFAQNLCAQYVSKGLIKGRVVDDSTNAPLPLANIFIANSTIGSVADFEGRFLIKEVPYGVHQVVASIVGYEPQSFTVHIIDTTKHELMFRLKVRNVQLSPILIEGSEPKEWKRNLQKFIDQFFGSTPNAAQCKLLNPEVLDFTIDEKTSEFTATVREPLVIENKALGYRFHYYLKYFALKNKVFQFFGIAKFEQLQTANSEEMERWKINRQNTYRGSIRHFFCALFHKNSEEEGFQVKSIPNKNDLSTEFHGNTPGSYSNIAGFYGNGEEVNPNTFVVDGKTIYEKILSFPEKLQVVFGNKIFTKKISLVELLQKSITIYSNGEIAEPLGILASGYWSTQRAAEILPSDYEPE